MKQLKSSSVQTLSRDICCMLTFCFFSVFLSNRFFKEANLKPSHRTLFLSSYRTGTKEKKNIKNSDTCNIRKPAIRLWLLTQLTIEPRDGEKGSN